MEELKLKVEPKLNKTTVMLDPTSRILAIDKVKLEHLPFEQIEMEITIIEQSHAG